jgi:hypothetical protein
MRDVVVAELLSACQVCCKLLHHAYITSMASLKFDACDSSGGWRCHVILNVVGLCRSAGILPSPASLPPNFINKPANHMAWGDGRVGYGARSGYSSHPSASSLFSSILPRHSIQKRNSRANAATIITVPRTFYIRGSYRCPERFAWSTVTICITAYFVRIRMLETYYWLVIPRVTVSMPGTSFPYIGVRGSLVWSSIMSPRLNRGSFLSHRFLRVHRSAGLQIIASSRTHSRPPILQCS